MTKDDPGGLFTKVAKFVRNPLKDWAELDQQDSAAPQGGYSRSMLKEMIERRQRNDFARRREFDTLRKLRQRKEAGATDAAALSSTFNMDSSSRSDGRAQTLKKIDEIEEQMAQQWWKGRAPGKTEAEAFAPGPDISTTQNARAYAATVPGAGSTTGDGAPSDLSAAETGAPSRLHASRLTSETAIEEAALRFAQGDDAGCEAILLQTIAPGNPGADHAESWLALLDMHRATGGAGKFERLRLAYAQRFGCQAPRWIALPSLASVGPAPAAPAAPPPAGGAHWRSPAQLTRASLLELTHALGAAGAVWDLDWHALKGIDADAVPALKLLFGHWGSSPVQLRFLGARQLLAVLAEATPTGDRETSSDWWSLRLNVLRAMHDDDGFELVALNYCLTYEVSPPPWQQALGSYAALDLPPAATVVPSGPAGPPLPGASGAASALEKPVSRHAVLAGELGGETLATWQRLDAELAGPGPSVISCAALLRMDLVAAGTLLNWVTRRDARGERVEFVEAHRLIAAFFNIIGIADHATVGLRAD